MTLETLRNHPPEIERNAEVYGYKFEYIIRDIIFHDRHGEWNLTYFEDSDPNMGHPRHFAVKVVGDVRNKDLGPVWVRVEDFCFPSMVLNHQAPDEEPSLACDCAGQHDTACAFVQNQGRGIVIVTPYEGRGHGALAHMLQLKIQGDAYSKGRPIPDTVTCFQENGFNPPDVRDYKPVAAIIKDTIDHDGEVNLLTNNPRKIFLLTRHGVNIATALNIFSPNQADYYMGANFEAKVKSLGHDSPPEDIPSIGVTI